MVDNCAKTGRALVQITANAFAVTPLRAVIA